VIGVVFKLLGRGFADLRVNPWAQTLTLAAVTLVAFLGGLFLLFLFNLNAELERARGELIFQVYWRPDADMDVVASQWEQLEHLPALAARTTYTPEQGLEALASSMGGGLDLQWLRGESPLPPTAVLAFSPDVAEEETWTRDMLAYLEHLPGVEKVHFNVVRANLARAWKGFRQHLVWPLIGFLGLVQALIVGNTVKLLLLSRRTEIEILHLVGARDWYIQLPLVVSGALHGFAGSALAVGLLKGVQYLIRDLLDFPPLNLPIVFFPWEYAAAMAGVLTLVGAFSGWVAVRR
jgi:cell division transport system permease protein